MSDQENSQVKIFFDSNRFPWERQYTDGKGNWYYSEEILYNQSDDSFYLIDFNGMKISVSLDSDLRYVSMTGLEDFNKPHGPEFDPMSSSSGTRHLYSLRSLTIRNRVQYTNYSRSSLFYCLKERKRYDPNTKKLVSFEKEIYVYDPQLPQGPYDPRNDVSWNKLCHAISEKNIKSIQIKEKKETSREYTLYIFEKYTTELQNITIV